MGLRGSNPVLTVMSRLLLPYELEILLGVIAAYLQVSYHRVHQWMQRSHLERLLTPVNLGHATITPVFLLNLIACIAAAKAPLKAR